MDIWEDHLNDANKFERKIIWGGYDNIHAYTIKWYMYTINYLVRSLH